MHGIVRMRPLPIRAHLFFLCLSHLLNGGSGLSHGSPKHDTVKEFQHLHRAESKRILSWTEIYVPVRRCHAILKNKMGEFSIPVIRNRHFKNVWCNWTIWAGPRNHIIIYVQGFRGSKDCEENPDKIIFQGVASVVESTIAYACWNKRVHIYATQALAVNVALLLKNYAQSHRYRHFRGKYYIFRDPRAKASQKEDPTFQAPFQSPSNKLPYNSTESKVELPVVMSQGGIEMASPELMPSKALQLERSYTWEREKVEFSETSFPCSERLSDQSHADGITVTKTLGVGEVSLEDGLFSKALRKTAALDTRWLEVTEEKSILPPGSTMDGSAVDVKILYENTPYFLGPEQSTIMEDWYINIKSGSTYDQTDYLIPTSEDVPINIKPTPISHSIFIVSDSEFLEKTEYSKIEKTQINPSQIWSSLSGSEQQPILQTVVLTHEAVTLSTDSMGNHMSSVSLASENQLFLQSSLHLIPVALTVHEAVGFSKSFKGGDLLTDPHSGVVISPGTIQTLGGSGMIWSSSPQIFSEAGLTLIVASADGIGLVPELPSTISIRSTVVRAEGELELLLQTARSLLGPAETENLARSVSEEVPTRHQVSPAETDLKLILGQERSLPFTAYQESLFDAELTPTSPQVAISEIVPEWALQDIPVPTSAYHNEQVTTEQSLGIPLTLTPAAMLKVKWPSVTPVEIRAELDSMLIVQSITTPFTSVNHEESTVATMLSLEIPLSYHSGFSKNNMEHYFSSPAVASLAFLPTPTLTINENELALSSLSSRSWADLGEMFPRAGKTEPLAFFTSRNVDFATSVLCPKCLTLDSRNFFDLLEGEHFIDEKAQSISQLVPKDELLQGRDASSGSEIPLVTKTYKMTPLSALQWIPTRTMTFSSELDELQNEVTVHPSKKDALVNESNLWKSSNSLGKDQKLTKFNFTSLVPSVPTMSLSKWHQFGDLSAVSSSLPLWSKDTNLLEAKKLQDFNQVLTSTNMVACIPMRRCHVVLKDTFGVFSLPENLNSFWSNICCNWTISAGSKEHIVVYIKGFEGPENCDQNQDKIIFQGVLSSVERKTFYACKNQGTLIFATQALAVHIVFLSVRSYPRYIPAFEGQYFVFTDPGRQVPPKPALASPLATSQRLRARILSKIDFPPELMTKPQSGSFPNLNTIYVDLENKRQMVTEILMLKNKELIEGERKALEWKHLHSLLPLIPAKGPLIKNQKSLPISLRQELSRPTETIKNSAGSSREVTTSSGFVWDSLSPGSLTEHSPSLETSRTALSFLREVVDSIHPNTGAVHPSAPMPNFKAMVPLTPGQVWKNLTTDGVLVLTPGYSDARTTSPSFGNESVLELQHYPGDILYEVIVEMECQVETPYNASEVEKVLVDSLKQEIGGNLGHFSPEADAFKLTGMKRKDTSNATFVFWLHLSSRERNMSDTLVSQSGAPESSEPHSQLRTLIRDTVEALQLHLKSTSIHDVNECEIGLEQCGDGAECFNGVGTYLCHCKEDYKDHSPMQSGTLCVHVPLSGVGFSFNYRDLLIAVAVFASVLLMLLIGFVWLATKTIQEERDFCLQETMSLEGVSMLPQTQTKACLNLGKLNKYPVYNPYQPKPPARVIDDSLGQIPCLNKDSHVCMEQSECLK